MTKFGPGALVSGYQSDMPGFKNKLSDEDMWAVLSYIESTWPADIRARQQGMNVPLVLGAGLFGIGWGLVGYCPGPALASILLGNPATVLFVVSMLAGMAAYSARGFLSAHRTKIA